MSAEGERGGRVAADYTFAQTPEYLFRLGLKPTPMVVFAALHRAGHWGTGTARVEHAEIAKACGISESTVKRAIKKLQEIGAVTVVYRQSESGEHLANDYLLHMAHPAGSSDASGSDPTWVQKHPERDPLLDPGGSKSDNRSSLYRGSSSEKNPPTPQRGDQKRPAAERKPRKQPGKTLVQTEAFKDFYKIHPRTTGILVTLRAWDAHGCEAIADQVIAGARLYRDDRNRVGQYTKSAANWLADGGWDASPQPERAPQSRAEAEQRFHDDRWSQAAERAVARDVEAANQADALDALTASGQWQQVGGSW